MEYTVVITATIEAASDEALRALIDEETPFYFLEHGRDINVEVDLGSARTQDEAMYRCKWCGREEMKCSLDPCGGVLSDREDDTDEEEEEDEPEEVICSPSNTI
jgi:hypothetical protein